jgi:signal transduction histidine kinase/ActR/RegA family two-component response regulator/stage V sporulation protein SpoVS
MRLSTRLATAMLAHAFITVVMLVAVNYRVFEAVNVPGAEERFRQFAKDQATDLEAATGRLPGELLKLRAAPAVDRIMQASGAAAGDAAVRSLAADRAELAEQCKQLLAAPALRECRLLAVADGGRDIVRVDRPAAEDSIHVVSDGELARSRARPSDEDLVRHTFRVADGGVFVSAVEADRLKTAGSRRSALLSVATPVRTPDHSPVAAVVITMDLDSAFAKIRAAVAPARPLLLSSLPPRSMFVINENGDYLLNPDPSRELGNARGEPERLQDDFPGLTAAAWQLEQFGPVMMRDRKGARVVIGLTGARLAGSRQVTLVQAMPFSAAYSTARAVLITTSISGFVAILCAIAIAILLARTMSKPIVAMTNAVTAFTRGAPMVAPTNSSGEIGVLARAFRRMADEVTEQTAAMRRTADILDLIMARMADAVLLVDAAAAILFANTAAKELLGDHAVVGWNAWATTYEAYRADEITPLEFVEWPLMRALHGENVDGVDMVLRSKGEERKVHLTISGRPIGPVGDAANGAVLVLRDVSVLKETERLLRDSQKMDAIGQLTGGVAHDFNNILTVITGTIDILSRGVADRPTLANIARMIDEAANRGTDLTRQLLAFARKQPLQPQVTDVNALVIDTAKLLRPTLGQQIEIESMLEDGVWPAMVDGTQLSTALLNLALNARDAMPTGGKLTLETANMRLDGAYIQAHPETRPGPYVMVAVQDTGAGIPPALHHKVFEPFFTTKEVGKGTGLGLSMVYGFVKQSGGHIEIHSEEGKGTAIKLYFPRSDEDVLARNSTKVPPLRGGHETILVVEDDALVRKYVISQLESLGYAPVAAANATEAIALVERGQTFDLLFTDIVMPGGMNGRELADEVVRRRPGARVLYTSGFTENAIVHQGRLDPDVALLSKPYRKLDLAQMIRKALGDGGTSAGRPIGA